MKNAFLLLILFLLTGCAVNKSTSTPTNINSKPILNTQIYLTPNKIVTSTDTTTITPSPTLIPTRTATQSAFFIHPLTPTAFPDYIELPEWLKVATNDDLFMAITGYINGGLQLSVINPTTQDQFNLPILYNSVFFWSSDGNSINVLNPNWELMTIDLKSGKVLSSDMEKKTLRFSPYIFDGNDPTPMIARGRVGEPNFLLLQVYQLRDISFDGKYFLHQDYYSEENPISVENLETGNIIPVTSPNDGINDTDYAWSPVGDKLAIIQTKTPPQPYYWPGDHLVIFDLEQNAVISSFEGVFSFIKWSGDGQNILYQKSVITDHKSGYGDSYIPCVINLKTGESKCFYTISFQANSDGAWLSTFNWFPGDVGITYLSSWFKSSSYGGNFCIYYFDRDRITCPTKDLADLSKRSVIRYSISPDGEYIVFDYDESMPMSDFMSYPYSSLIRTDGTGYLQLWSVENRQKAIEITGEKYNNNPVYIGVLWRPVAP